MQRMFLATLFVAAIVPFGAGAASSITLQSRLPYARHADVPTRIKTQCRVAQDTAKYIIQWAEKGMQVHVKNRVSSRMRGKVLVTEITSATGAGGGAWSGGKSITTRGTLYDNGHVIGSFIASRHSSGGLFGAYMGTCKILARDSKALGKDIGTWLQAPHMHSRLGDSK